MTQFQHTLIAFVLFVITTMLIKHHLVFPQEYAYWEKKWHDWFGW